MNRPTVTESTPTASGARIWLIETGMDAATAGYLVRAAERHAGTEAAAVPYIHRVTYRPGESAGRAWRPAHYWVERPTMPYLAAAARSVARTGADYPAYGYVSATALAADLLYRFPRVMAWAEVARPGTEAEAALDQVVLAAVAELGPPAAR